MTDLLLIILFILIIFPAFGIVAVGVSIAWILKVILVVILVSLLLNLIGGRRWW